MTNEPQPVEMHAAEAVTNGTVNGAGTEESAAVNGCDEEMEVTGADEIKVRNTPFCVVLLCVYSILLSFNELT